jgi:predicted AAA+ superfamily ATPase
MLSKEIISAVIESQKEISLKHEPGINRVKFHNINILEPSALLFLGVRGAGKTSFLRQFLKVRFQNPFLLNLEDPRLSGFEMEDFLQVDRTLLGRDNEALAFDEIQVVEGWDSYMLKRAEDSRTIFLAASNAALLRSDFGTKMNGGYLLKEIFPFSFGEFLEISGKVPSVESVEEYIDAGGFPEYLRTRNEEVLYRILEDILFKDIAVRHGIKQYKALYQLAIHLISNPGNHYSLHKLKNSIGISSIRSVADYVSFFEESYLLFSVPKYSKSKKKQIANPRKIYCVDTGLARALSLSTSQDMGDKLENLVYLHLRRKQKSIYYYSELFECDFIVLNEEGPATAVQVCYNLDQANYIKKLKGLEAAMKDLKLTEGIIVTFDQEESMEVKGGIVRAIPVWKYLLGH